MVLEGMEEAQSALADSLIKLLSARLHRTPTNAVLRILSAIHRMITLALTAPERTENVLIR